MLITFGLFRRGSKLFSSYAEVIQKHLADFQVPPPPTPEYVLKQQCLNCDSLIGSTKHQENCLTLFGLGEISQSFDNFKDITVVSRWTDNTVSFSMVDGKYIIRCHSNCDYSYVYRYQGQREDAVSAKDPYAIFIYTFYMNDTYEEGRLTDRRGRCWQAYGQPDNRDYQLWNYKTHDLYDHFHFKKINSKIKVRIGADPTYYDLLDMRWSLARLHEEERIRKIHQQMKKQQEDEFYLRRMNGYFNEYLTNPRMQWPGGT